MDRRGTFARMYSRKEFADRGVDAEFDEWSVSVNHGAGTLRGLHYQLPPYTEGKLVWCAEGSAFDVLVDLRPASSTFGNWAATELRPEGPIVYVPPGVAHGFQTLEDETTIQYHIAGEYHPEVAAGVRWDDPILGIPWPHRPPTQISDRDRSWPLLDRLTVAPGGL